MRLQKSWHEVRDARPTPGEAHARLIRKARCSHSHEHPGGLDAHENRRDRRDVVDRVIEVSAAEPEHVRDVFGLKCLDHRVPWLS